MDENNELHEMQRLTHQYRNSLAAYEARTGRVGQHVDFKGSGEDKQLFARMDADLTAIELRAQLKATEERLAKLEAQPTLESRATLARGDANDPDSAAYAARWLKAVVTGNQPELRALSLSSSNAGIPTDMERRIVQKLQDANVMRQIAVVTQIDSKRTIPVENALPTTALTTETTSITASDPTFSAAIAVVPYKYATRVLMSQEFIEDAIGTGGPGSALDYVASKCALSIALKQEEAYTIGTGSSQPQGITAATAGIAQGVDLGAGVALTTVTADNLIDAAYTPKPVYRNSPRYRWLISDAFLRTVRKVKNTVTASGQLEYIWTPGTSTVNALVGGMPATIAGIPYSVGQYMPTTTGNDTIYAVVGDFSYFEIFDRTGITSMLDPYSNAATHQTNLILYSRTDSRIMLPEAFAYIRG